MEDNINEMCKNCKYREMSENRKTPDLGEMIKLAMMVSKMLGQRSPAGQSAPTPVPASVPEPSNQSIQTQQIANIDSLIEDKKIKIIKSSIPFLQPEHQQMMHLTTKFLEIKNILNSQLYVSRVHTSSAPEERSLGMLRAIMPHLDSDEKNKVEAACKALEMITIMKSMEKIKASKEESDNEENNTILDEPVKFTNGDT